MYLNRDLWDLLRRSFSNSAVHVQGHDIACKGLALISQKYSRIIYLKPSGKTNRMLQNLSFSNDQGDKKHEFKVLCQIRREQR